MRFKAKKSYGNYKTSSCPFCGKIATNQNEQGLDVCTQHTKRSMEEIKCTCGSWLELKKGKFGPYFNCMKCGNLNYQRAMEIKSMTQIGLSHIERTKEETSHIVKKEITIDSNDPNYFD
jgi:hypothetical protein